jgi:hypothetical protein
MEERTKETAVAKAEPSHVVLGIVLAAIGAALAIAALAGAGGLAVMAVKWLAGLLR